MESYNEVEFWNNKKNPIPKRELTKEEIDIPVNFIKEQLKGCKSVLDFGPGKGRTFSALTNMDRVEAYDISDNWKNEVINNAKSLKLKNFNITFEKEIKELPYKDKEFDAVISSLVLLHQRPQNILFVMKELVRVGKKVVVISHYNKNRSFNIPNQYLPENSKIKKFNYNYETICEDQGWKFTEYLHRTDKLNHIYFIYENNDV